MYLESIYEKEETVPGKKNLKDIVKVAEISNGFIICKGRCGYEDDEHEEYVDDLTYTYSETNPYANAGDMAIADSIKTLLSGLK